MTAVAEQASSTRSGTGGCGQRRSALRPAAASPRNSSPLSSFTTRHLHSHGWRRSMRALLAGLGFLLFAGSALAQDPSDTVTVGPWKIATTYEADNFKNCTMSR